jgi:hypothetical protein
VTEQTFDPSDLAELTKVDPAVPPEIQRDLNILLGDEGAGPW